MPKFDIVKLWQDELKQSSRILRRMYNVFEADIQDKFDLEKSLIIGCFLARKLDEAGWIKSGALREKINITTYKRCSEVDIDLSAEDDWIKSYDLMEGVAFEINGRAICNQVIHSKFLSGFSGFGNQIWGAYVVSDRDYKEHLKYVQLVKFIEIFEGAALDKIVRLDIEIIDGKRIQLVNAQ